MVRKQGSWISGEDTDIQDGSPPAKNGIVFLVDVPVRPGHAGGGHAQGRPPVRHDLTGKAAISPGYQAGSCERGVVEDDYAPNITKWGYR